MTSEYPNISGNFFQEKGQRLKKQREKKRKRSLVFLEKFDMMKKKGAAGKAPVE